MASRRSRLSVRPNIGPRGKGPAGPSVKPRPKDDAVNPTSEQTLPKPAEISLEKSSTGENVEKSSQKQVELSKEPEKASELRERTVASKPPSESPAAIEPVASAAIQQKSAEVAKDTEKVHDGVVKDKDVNAAEKSVDKPAAPRMRSRFPKAKPNISLDVSRARKRHPSIGTSDNEDELKKHPPPVQRVVTVASSASTPVSASNERVPFIPTQLANNNNKKKKDVARDVTPAQQKVPEKDADVVVKPATRTRKRKVVRSDDPPDRSKMTMKDLIYWNPTSNPMKSTVEEVKRKKKETETLVEDEERPAMTEDKAEEEEGDESIMAPQLKIGPDGEIILNEESLVVDASPQKPVYDSNSDVVHESETRVTSASFKKRTCAKVWNAKDTARFYKALSCVGTDFSMMSNLFPKRSRAELKNKFKKEERSSKALVDKAIKEQITFDLSLFDSDHSESENIEEQALPKRRKGSKVLTKNAKNKLVTTEDNVGSGDGHKTIARADEHDMSEDEELEIIDHMCQRPTRSGRLPKPNPAAASPSSQLPGRPVSMIINGKQVVTTSVTRPPGVVRIPSFYKSPTPSTSTASPGNKSPGFTALPQQGAAGPINVNQMSPGQLVFVQSTQPGGSQVLHVYVVSPSGVLSKSQLPPSIGSPHVDGGQSLLKPSSPPNNYTQPTTSLSPQSPTTEDASRTLASVGPKPVALTIPSTHISDDPGPVSPPLKDVTTQHLLEHMQSDISEEVLDAVTSEVQLEKLVTSS